MLPPCSVRRRCTLSDEGCCCVNGGCSTILTASCARGYLCACAVRPFITSSICWCHYSTAFGEKRERAHNKIKLNARQLCLHLKSPIKSLGVWRAASRPLAQCSPQATISKEQKYSDYGASEIIFDAPWWFSKYVTHPALNYLARCLLNYGGRETWFGRESQVYSTPRLWFLDLFWIAAEIMWFLALRHSSLF